MAAPFPSSSRMDAWPERRGLQTMNLRSVFTLEQQRILERYYENGMTNQSKACFQLILQCAQEAKLDFSVVRTWVGNKRRKIASKAEQNDSLSHALPSHGLAERLLSNHTFAGGTLPNPSLVVNSLVPSDVVTARSIQNRVHLFPPSSSFPSFSSTSSSPSSSSPLSSGSGNNNNNDVILTGIYSLNSVPRPRPRPPAQLPNSELSANTSPSFITNTLQKPCSSSLPLQSKPVSLTQNPTSLASASGPLVHTAVRKGTLSTGETIGVSAGQIPQSWTRQYGTTNNLPWYSASSSKTQTQPRPHSNPQPQSTAAAPQKVRVSVPTQTSATDQTLRIQQVFTLSEKDDWNTLVSRTTQKSQDSPSRPVVTSLDTCHNFSIAMETGDEEDEWQREEELANMAAQTHIHRGQQSSPDVSEVLPVRSINTQPATISKTAMLQGNASLQGSYSVTAQTSLTIESSSQTSVGASAGPWIMSNSRKRTLQDRTQFSDGDLIQLKRYWDRGMTSLGSVCKDKINAAANQLNVDTEIVKTWISNRRRKYRLMGIEIPPPKGGPAVFTSSPGNESPVALSPRLQTPDLMDDLNDGFSEDGTIDSHYREGDDDTELPSAPIANNIKIEVSDNDDEDGDMMASDLVQMQSLLEFKHEEVQFLENELENQKQKYQELASFTKSLLNAVRNKDLERQQELLDSLPQSSDQDWDQWDRSVEEEIQTATLSADECTDHKGFPGTGGETTEFSMTPANEDDKSKLPSASEGQQEETVE